MTYAVSGFRIAGSNAERAEQIFQIVDTVEEATEKAEKLLSDERIRDVAVWQFHGRPTIIKQIKWENL